MKNQKLWFLVARTRLYTPLCRSVGPSVRRSVRRSVRHTLLFRRFLAFWPYRSCPNAPVTSNMAPAHPHATGVAVYPALFNRSRVVPNFALPFFLPTYQGKHPVIDSLSKQLKMRRGANSKEFNGKIFQKSDLRQIIVFSYTFRCVVCFLYLRLILANKCS